MLVHKKLNEKKIIIAGSEGLLGNEISKYFEVVLVDGLKLIFIFPGSLIVNLK